MSYKNEKETNVSTRATISILFHDSFSYLPPKCLCGHIPMQLIRIIKMEMTVNTSATGSLVSFRINDEYVLSGRDMSFID